MAADRIQLSSGKLRLTLCPSIGGSIEVLEWVEGERSRSIMRQSPEPLTNVLEAASFPLVPYVNRIRGGEFTFRGRTVRIAPNMAGDVSPLHGQGWLNAWTVESADDSCAVLTYVHKAGEWPWAYEARQEFALDERGCSVVLSCRNTSEEPMPCGLGEHPYFPCGPETRIDTRVSHVWTIDEHVLPVDKVPAEGRYDLRDRLVCGQDLDHGFGGWGGEARLTDPDWPFRVRISSGDAHFFQLYSPAAGGIFVAEPVSHANAALNAPEEQWPNLGMQVLDPGESLSLAMRLDVEPVEP
ncbi:MAG: aldose 1-epimerase [Pseudomonadota bacterium]